jgi:hypothetical protein
MADGATAAAVLLVAGPLLGLLGFYDIALYTIWTAPREEHLAMVAAHRRGWIAVNAGFMLATLATTTGLALLTASVDVDTTARAVLAFATSAYALGGVFWCAVNAIRLRTTPLLAAMVARGEPTEPGESILGAATGGLFAVFAVIVGLALAGLGLGLALGAVVAAPVAWLIALAGVLVVAWQLRTGDIIPAVVYLPTLVLGIVILLGGAA